jgi:hypothetical protein
MLGENIGEGKGKRTVRRVVSTSPEFKIEVSFEDITTLLGAQGMNIGTYVSGPKPDGSIHGEGEGVFQTMEGDMATWKGMGVGRFSTGGSVSYRGVLSYTTSSPRLTRLNGVAAAFEFDVDGAGNTQSKFFEWK